MYIHLKLAKDGTRILFNTGEVARVFTWRCSPATARH